MSNNESVLSEFNLLDLIKFVIGLILGGGMVGGITQVMQQSPNSSTWGYIIIILCIVVSVMLILISPFLVRKIEKSQLKELGRAFDTTLTTTVQFLSFTFGGNIEQRKMFFQEMVDRLKEQSDERIKHAPKSKWVISFKQSIDSTVAKCQDIAESDKVPGAFPGEM